MLERLRRIRITIEPTTIVLVGWAFFLVYAYPGYMSTDSVDQLNQARAFHFTDWHPPLMAYEWALLELFITGPFGMLLVQSALFFFGVHLLLARVATPRTAAIAAVIVCLFPPVATTMAVIWKDSQMAGYLVMGAALIISPRRRIRGLGYACLFVACGMRYNAAAAIAPLVFYALRLPMRWWKRLGVTALITIALFFSSSWLGELLTDEHQYPWSSSLALMDLSGTIRELGPASDDEIRDELEGCPLAIHDHLYQQIYATYNPRTWWYLTHGDQRIFDPPATDEQRAAIARAWRRMVFGHPRAYFTHRRRVFWHLLGSKQGDEELWSSVYHNITEDPMWIPILHHDAKPAAFQRWEQKWLDRHMNDRMFRPYLYFWATVLALIVCGVLVRTGELALLASGLLYELSYLVVAPSPDNRYSHWMFTMFTLAGMRSLLDARAAARRRSSPP
ncbi:MAG TPA: hypothetical protein VL463_04560 [Kofleriaceae bacterium]|nr:hypothetical protein [Kofleriaceae bacterium]